MAFNLGEVFITLKSKGEGLKNGLDDADRKVSSMSKSMSNSFHAAERGSAVLLGTLTAVTGAAVIFGKKSVDAYFAAEEAQTKLRTNMLNVKGATDAQVDSLGRLATHLQRVGVIEDDTIKAGMSQLATFNLQGKTIETLTPKITDMVAQLKGHNATAEDMVTINNLVGKVMTGNVGALSRYGVTLDENQKKVLQNGTESERAAMLTKVLAQNYGDVNEELRKTPQGRITGLKNAFGDLQEGVGQFIVTAIGPLVDGFSSWVGKMDEAGGMLEYGKKLIKDNQDVLIPLAGALMFALVPALVAGAAAMWGLFAPLLPFLAAGAVLTILLKKLADRMGGWGNLWDVIKPKLEAGKDALIGVWNILQLLVTGDFKGGIFGMTEDSTLIDWLFKIREGFFQFWQILQQVADYVGNSFVAILEILGKAWDGLWPSIEALVMSLWNNLLPAFQSIYEAVMRLWNAINPAFMVGLRVLATIIGVLLYANAWLFINVLNITVHAIGAVIKIVVTLIGWLSNVIKWYGNVYGAAINLVGGIIGWFGRLPGAIGSIVNSVVDWFRRLPGRIGGVIGGIVDVLQSPFRQAFNAIAGLWNRTVGRLNFKAPSWVPGFGGKGWSMPQLPMLALGTADWRGGLAGMNEFGPETAVLPKGTKVITADQTRRNSEGQGGSGNTYHLNLSGIAARSGTELADIIYEGIQVLDRRLDGAGKPQILGGQP